MAKVELKSVGKVFHAKQGEEIPAVRNVNLTVADRELLVIVGPSGCGKTTVLRMIAGLEGLSSGTITIDGMAMNTVPPQDRDIAMIFQRDALYPHMTVFENLSFGLQLRKTSPAETLNRVHETAAMLGLSTLLQRYPRALSGGERQRAALGRALVRKPRLLLLDEPLSQLDAPLRAQLRAEIARLHQQLGTTMIYVTHDQIEAMTLGQRIAVMNEGVVQQVAEPRTLVEQPANAFVAEFMHSVR